MQEEQEDVTRAVAEDEPPVMEDPGNDSDDDSMEEVEPPPRRALEFFSDDSDEEDDVAESDDASTEAGPPDETMRDRFLEFCDSHERVFGSRPVDAATVNSIRLMEIMRKAKTPLNAYQPLLEWHLRETGHLRDQTMTLKDTNEYFSRETLMKKLFKRHGCEPLKPRIKKVKLPHSNYVASVPIRDARDVIASLLTDPRTKQEDYLFFDGDPLASPPEPVVHLEDLNTGDAYLKTHKALIKEPNEILLPLVLYIDGAVTGQFSDLPVTALKVALGIHTREYRDREYAWKELGWLPTVRAPRSRGRKLFKETDHLEAEGVQLEEGEGDSQAESDSEDEPSSSEDDEQEETVKAQDFHTLLDCVLDGSGLLGLLLTGFMWNLVVGDTEYRNAKLVPYVSHVKCDNKEADANAAKYEVRTGKVKQICRVCVCPTSKSDDPRPKYKYKTQAMIQKLVDRRDLKKLKDMSQQCLHNAWYRVKFHRANERGIHGACPCDKLHTILLGVFKYATEAFFEQVGKDSLLAKDMNGLASLYGGFLGRQSDRSMPLTQFHKGVQRGKKMAKEHRGVLLVLAAVLVSTKGRELLRARKRFRDNNGTNNWSLLLEKLLEWEAFLCLHKINKTDVRRLERKHVFIMYLIRKVGRREEGMGLKIIKFHAIKHLVDDMLLYGTPSEMDTGSNEGHHKPSKYAAKLTQRKEATFNYQTATRMTEFHALDLCIMEINGGDRRWEYYDYAVNTIDCAKLPKRDSMSVDSEELVDEDEVCLDMRELNIQSPDDGASDSEDSGESSSGTVEDFSDSEDEWFESEDNHEKIVTGGTRIQVFEDEDNNYQPDFVMVTRSERMKRNTILRLDILTFLNNLQNLTRNHLPNRELNIMTMHKRDGVIFRGHPNFNGDGAWRDWAIFDWGRREKHLPCHIWCFVELRNMPTGKDKLEYGGIDLQDGVFAVVEIATYDDPQLEHTRGRMTDLFTPLTLITDKTNPKEHSRKFYLAETEAIVGPCVVVPDVGGKKDAFFQVKPRETWAELFLSWLRRPHKDDLMDWTDSETEKQREAEREKKRAEKRAKKATRRKNQKNRK
jgi:hypothetical protein